MKQVEIRNKNEALWNAIFWRVGHLTSDKLVSQDHQGNIPSASHAFHEGRQQLKRHTEVLIHRLQ